MKRAKYVLLLIVFILIAVGIKTIIPKGEKSIAPDKTIGDSIRQYTQGGKDVNRDSIAKDSICLEETLNQNIINENANELQLTFVDAVTGYAVVPENIEIKKRGTDDLNRNISRKEILNNNSVIKHVSNGVYDITVYAEGYKPMQTFFDFNKQTVNINFNLVPVNRPKELSVSYIQSLHQDEAMVIVGSILDDSTRKPLEHVEVYTEDNIEKTFSNKSGFFQLIIPLAEKEEEVQSRGTIYFKLNQYITEERENFDMWPNGDFIFKIKLKKGSGLNKKEVIQNRKINRTILTKSDE